MVQRSTYIYAVIVVSLITTTIWQWTKQTAYYLSDPLKISVLEKAVEYEDFSQVIVCSTTWAAEDLNTKGMNIDVIQYAMGFITNSNLHNLEKSVAWDLARNRTRYLAAKAAFEAEKEKSGFSYRNFTVSRSGIVQVQMSDQHSDKLLTTLSMAPFHVGDQVLCGKVLRYAPAFAISLTKLESFTEFPFLERPSFRMLMPSTDILTGQGPMSKLITFYNNPYWPLLSPNRHFLNYGSLIADKPKPTPKDDLPMTIVTTQININKHVALNSRTHPCEVGDSTARFPIGFGMRVCQIFCEEVAINAVYGCSSLSLLDIPQASTNLPPCNVFDYLHDTKEDQPFFKFSEVDKIKRECQIKRDCQNIKFCTEWKIEFTSTTMRKDGTNRTKELNTLIPGEYHVIDIAIPSTMTVAIADKVLNWEGFLGSLGGIVGMWLGSSALALAHFIINGIMKWRKWKREEISEADADKDKNCTLERT